MATVLGSFVFPAGSTAQSTDEAYRHGLDAMHAGRFEEAAVSFEALYAKSAEAHLLFQLGIVYASLGWPHEAVARFEEYLLVADPAADAANVRAARAETARLRSESAVLVLGLSPPNAAVVVDGRPTKLLRKELLLAPGPRDLAVRAEGYVRHDQRIDAKPGRFTLDVVLVLAPAATVDTTPASVPPAAAAPAPTVAVAPAAAPAPAEAPPSAPAEPPPREEPDDGPCAGGDWCLGPVVTLGALGLVGPGFHVRHGDHLGFRLDFQMLPSITIGDGALSLYVLSGGVRVYPFAGAGLFLSGGFALYGATGSAAVQNPLTGEFLEGEGSVSFPGIVFGLGFMTHHGFVIGIDFEGIVPIGATTVEYRTVRGDPTSPLATAAEANVRKATDDVLAALPFVPQVNLLRLGYLF